VRGPQQERESVEVAPGPAGPSGAHVPGDEERAATAELGDESGQDVDPAALAPGDGTASLPGVESELSAAEDRAPAADHDQADVRR
jgi:hypothetical protein